MRKRLTLKSRVSPVHYEMDSKEEETSVADNNTEAEQFEDVNIEEEEDAGQNENNEQEARAIVLSQVSFFL